VDHLRELPTEVERVLHAQPDALSTGRVVDVRRVTGQEYPALAVVRRLAGHVGESGDPGGVVNAEVGPERGSQGRLEIVERRIAVGSDLALGGDDAVGPAVLHEV
jgi:hypothetical protein